MQSFGKHTEASEVAQALSSEIKGKVVLLTGVSPTSIAYAVAQAIAPHQPALLILASRNLDKLRQVEVSLKQATPNVAIRLLTMDMASLKAVKAAAEEVLSWDEPLDVLINSAGIMAADYKTSVDGYESQFAICHLAHFLFTQLLTPKLLASKGRVVNITSTGHWIADPKDWQGTGFNEGRAYDRWAAYGFAKSANILHAHSLAIRGLLAYSVHPGATVSGLHTSMPEEARAFFVQTGAVSDDGKYEPRDGNAMIAWKTPEACAAGYLVAAFSSDAELVGQSGAYLIDCEIANEQLAPWINDGGAEKLWAVSERHVKQALQ